jgi:Sec-independent protein translocase protein TatA
MAASGICFILVVVILVFLANRVLEHPKDLARRVGQFTQQVSQGYNEGRKP